MTLDERLKDVFADAFEVEREEINEDMSIKTCKSWDSMRSITLSVSVEQTFEIEFTDKELLAIDSYASIRQLLIDKGVV